MRAGYRHRCVCIEGSVSLENVLDMIDFAPKVGYNAYFTQFMEAYTFFERWYTHKGNPLRAAESFSPSLSREMLAAAVEAIQKRGLLYHAVGHGWTCEPLGIPGLHWEDDGIELAPEQRECMAQVDGTRGLYRGIALNTNLCYSNPRVRGLMARAIARYAAEHPEIDVLHVWLADDFNNQCECPACQTARPSDFYVMLLNEVDDLMTRQGIPVRIAFLLYFDLLFPPERERLKNPDRFLLMYAPITRSFARSFEGVQPSEDLPAYRRNRLSFGSSLSGNLGYLKAWQRVFHGDSFDFDYHLCSVAYSDPAQMTIGRVLHSDIRALRALGLNGMANCQIQRIFTRYLRVWRGRRSAIRRRTISSAAARILKPVSEESIRPRFSCWRNTAPGFPWSCMRRTIRSPARRPRAALKDFGCFYRAFARPSGRACTRRRSVRGR